MTGRVNVAVVAAAFVLGLAISLGLQIGEKIDGGAADEVIAASPIEAQPSSTVTSTSTSTTTIGTKAKRTATYPTDELLRRLALCETGGTMNPRAYNPGNADGGPYYGYFQFDAGTWWSVGGEGYPWDHPYEVQRDLARTLILQAGWSRFPTCSHAIGGR